ncbi:hypothetical protein QUF58_04620 [Anaerolineales bacterium HSG24]|nr:hypothetical protein [Anaerolineales bacterium HSG24]
MKILQSSDTQQMSIILPNQSIPKLGHLDMQVTISATVNVSAEQARRLVNRYIHRNVSYLMHGDAPNLMVAEHIYWQVPIIFTYPSYGVLGTVGVIDVNVETGELKLKPETITEIKQHAQKLADHSTPETAPTS